MAKSNRKELRILMEKYAQLLVEQGSDSLDAKKLIAQNSGNREFVESAGLARLLHIGLGTKMGEGNKLDHSEPIDGDDDPSYRRWRVLVSVRHIGQTGIQVWVSGRPAKEQIYIPFVDLPKNIIDNIYLNEDTVISEKRFYAQANFGHPDPTQIIFSNWEIP